jgi:heptosyltransferase III
MQKRIFIFRPGQFGDTLVAFPAIQGLSRAFPNAQIIYCSNKFRKATYVWAEEIIRLSPFISSSVTYYVEDSAIQRWKYFREQITISHDDVFLYLSYAGITPLRLLRDFVFFKSLGPWKMSGFYETLCWYFKGKRLQNDNVQSPSEIERIWDITKSALRLEHTMPCSCELNKDDSWIGKKIQEWGITGKELLAVCPGSKMQSKRWPIERYEDVGRIWHGKTGAILLVIGGPEEQYLADALILKWKGYGFSCCGANLLQTAGILSRCRAYCGNDTGSMHLAALLEIPCVALFSAREMPRRWYPLGDKNIILYPDIECANCMKVTCSSDPSRCISKISIEGVLSALNHIWRSARTKCAV